MEVPVIDFSELKGEKRSETMALLHMACEKWGFFMIENHGINKELMERVKMLINTHYEDNMMDSFYNSDTAKNLNDNVYIKEKDWETTFFIWHRPNNCINDLTSLSEDFRKTMDEYINEVIKLAEMLSELMCENLGIEKKHMMDTFSGSSGPSVGTKVAMYPQCPNPELIRGLREHTDAGGIILLLQDDQIPGLEFFKDGKWVKIPPSINNRIFINTGDQVEILSNGMYKSALHRVMAMKDGKRLSVATFYNPAGDAVISPASKLLLPNHFSFGEYLKLYSKTKFGDKGLRFQSLKNMANGHRGVLSAEK
ncbi:1-aminocyclopropane-1-carboxylate oxidase 1 [Andrographis paniculata]|uniref:1-aminocyclopropane-1-carboxylate oxidase 1 n=1 Tax=Andrographis paniculata TaxID=175694 RepID=UPI0021E98B3F|nr:1-aminocyclopropane-1-carboxylate oxidase 1 [Andrographis paniculata]